VNGVRHKVQYDLPHCKHFDIAPFVLLQVSHFSGGFGPRDEGRGAFGGLGKSGLLSSVSGTSNFGCTFLVFFFAISSSYNV